MPTRLAHNAGEHDHYATVLCALIDVDLHSPYAGERRAHAPLLVEDGGARFIALDGGVPIGVSRRTSYLEQVVAVTPDTTLLAFTDGLVARRGEVLDAGFARLREAVAGQSLPPSELLAKLVRDRATDEHRDDIAIVGIRWHR